MVVPTFPPVDQLPPEYVAENISHHLLATCISFLIIDTLAISLLYISRYVAGEQKMNWYMIVLMSSAYITCLAKISIGFLAVHIGGVGRHTVTLSYDTITIALQLNTAMQILCPLTTALSKMSILCMLYTIFGRTSARYRLVIRVTFVLCLVTMLVQFIIPFANCKPFSATWNLGAQDEACAIDGIALWRYLSIPNVLSTLLVVAIPIPALYKLHASRATKLGLAVILSVCACGIVAAIMRFASFLAVEDFRDFNYEQVTPLCWTIAESGIYMLAGVLPTLRPLMRKVFWDVHFERMFSGLSKKSKSKGEDSWSIQRGSTVAANGAQVRKGNLSILSNEDTVVGHEDEEKGMI